MVLLYNSIIIADDAAFDGHALVVVVSYTVDVIVDGSVVVHEL